MISIIVAMSENRVIGRSGDLPWHLPADLKRFKALTTGHSIIMGRKTFDSIGRPLPNRTSIVITRNADYRPEGIIVVDCLDEALKRSEAGKQVFIIGGGEIYRLALPRADRLYITMVHAMVEGDTFFPELLESEWELIGSDRHEADQSHDR